MTKRLTLAVIALSLAASAAVYTKVPEPRFGAGAYRVLPAGKPMLAFLLPAAAALIYALFLWLSRRDPVRDRSARFEATYHNLVFRIVLFIVALHAMLLASLIYGRTLASRAVPILVGLGAIAVGDLLPRLRPNVALGLRTPQTLVNRELWMRVHRVVGYATVAFGIVIVVTGLVLSPRAVGNVVLSAGLAMAVAIGCYCRRITRSVSDGNR